MLVLADRFGVQLMHEEFECSQYVELSPPPWSARQP